MSPSQDTTPGDACQGSGVSGGGLVVVAGRLRGGGGPPPGGIRMKLSINSRRQFDGFVLLAQALTQYLCGGLSSSRRLCY